MHQIGPLSAVVTGEEIRHHLGGRIAGMVQARQFEARLEGRPAERDFQRGQALRAQARNAQEIKKKAPELVEKVRNGGRVQRKCVVIAHAVHETGRREIIGLDVGEAETEAFWREFLRGLIERGLIGVQLAISDAHPGLKAALAQVLGAPWQRCTVHFLRDCLGHARKDQHGLLAALIRPIFRAQDGEEARRRLGEAVGQLQRPLRKVAAMLEEAEEDILAFYAFPAEHWPKLRSTNPLERFNREIGRRTDVVGIFPDDASLIRLVSMLAIEANDEWLVSRGYISLQSMEPLFQLPIQANEREEVLELQAA